VSGDTVTPAGSVTTPGSAATVEIRPVPVVSGCSAPEPPPHADAASHAITNDIAAVFNRISHRVHRVLPHEHHARSCNNEKALQRPAFSFLIPVSGSAGAMVRPGVMEATSGGRLRGSVPAGGQEDHQRGGVNPGRAKRIQQGDRLTELPESLRRCQRAYGFSEQDRHCGERDQAGGD